MEQYIDLHNHTTASDGSETPAAAVALAAELGLAAIAVTDHDSVSGLAEAAETGKALGVEVIPGIEVSADYRGNRAHILGLFIDPASESLLPVLNWAVGERERRNERIIAAMEADGFDISLEDLRREYPDSVLGRPHMAEHLMRKGYVSSVKEAFDRYLGDGRPYYRDRERISLSEAVRCIRGAGGIAIVAHPFQYGYDERELLSYIATAAQAGCAGIEAYYSEHSPVQQEYLLDLAQRRGLLVSGGSDWHGTRKPLIRMGSGIDGGLSVPYEVLTRLRRAL